MGPLDYTTDVLNPIEGYMQGLKFGEGILTDRLNRDATTQNMGIQRENMDLAQAQFAAQERERAQQAQAAQAQAAAAQAQAQAGQEAALALYDAAENGTLTTAQLEMFKLTFPAYGEAAAEAVANFSEERIGNEAEYGQQLVYAIQSGNIETARDILETRLEAAAGDPQAEASYKAQILALEADPNGLKTQTILGLSQLMEPDELEQYLGLIGMGAEADAPASYEALRLRARDAGLEPDTPEYQKFMLENGGGSGPLVENIIGAEETAFDKAIGGANAETFITLANTGTSASRNISELDGLETLLSEFETGAGAGFKAFLGGYGINTDGLSEIQAAQAAISRLVPAQRTPGSGPMSDADLELFKKSLPALLNQPGGNQRIIDTIRAINEYDIAASIIAGEVLDKILTPSAGRAAMRDLVNPLSNFKAPAGGAATSDIPKVATDADYEALPSGAQFIDPDGVTRRKP